MMGWETYCPFFDATVVARDLGVRTFSLQLGPRGRTRWRGRQWRGREYCFAHFCHQYNIQSGTIVAISYYFSMRVLNRLG